VVVFSENKSGFNFVRIKEMNRNTSTLLSLGVSAVLIAAGVWFLYNHSFGVWPGHSRWAMGHHGMMGGGMGIVMIIFWIVLIAAVILLFSGAVNGLRGTKQNREDASNPFKRKGLWGRYLDRLNKATGGKPPCCH
jgi:uncharacterized membrane protein